MKHCLIHIGTHKTGSTSIQESLKGYRDDRFLYARLDMANHSVAMYSLFAPHPEQHHMHRAQRTSAAQLSRYIARMKIRLERSFATSGDRTLLLSAEDISTLPRESLARMHDYLKAHFERITIVGYIRPPAGFISSGFQERVKHGQVTAVHLELEYRNYEAHFRAFDEVFGRENVHWWKFDPGTFPQGCAVRDFCARVGISLPETAIVRRNESLPRHVVALFYTYRKFGEKLGFDVMRAGEGERLGKLLAATTGGERFRFSPEALKPVLEKNRADIQWMEARLGRSFEEDLGGHRHGDIRGEPDLLALAQDVAVKLLVLLGDAAPPGITGRTPEEVALLVHALRRKHARLSWL